MSGTDPEDLTGSSLPLSSRDFLGAARQRFTAAELLLRENLNLDAMYLAGYTVECALKALILHNTGDAEHQDTLARITSGASMHRPEVLFGEPFQRGMHLPPQLARRFRRFDWDTNL